MANISDFKSLQDEIQAALIATTRTTGQISSEDLGFQRSLNPEIGPALDEQSERVLALASALLKSAASISDLRVPVLQDAEDVDNNWRGIVDVVDSLLEKADTSLDEYTGVIKRKGPSVAEATPTKSKKSPYALGSSFRTQNLVKPQLAFELKPDNNDTSPWRPLLTTKPHAIQPLQESLGLFPNEFDQQQYQHPYETEIRELKYPDFVYTKSDPIPYLDVENTSAIYVDTEDGVLEMLKELKSATEIAVDLEHHDARTFVGVVSLMQISTRNKDWIVDTLKPWRHKLQILNEVFTDPLILKVFHGAFMDIVWLQRDLGLYIVGLFDTHHASRSLGYAGGSLAFLLKKFIDFDADKKYQMADWRIRPLPEEMLYYARSDTHYLLYIYDMMRNELIDRSNTDVPDENRIELVLQKSKETSLLRYERQVYNPETGKGPGGWYGLILKTPSMLNDEQFSVFRAIHQWRDQVARADDDSVSFVMPNHVIFSLAKLIPKDMVALLGIAHPVSYSVKSRTGELLQLIQEAKARGKDGPSMINVLRPDSVGAVKASLPARNSPPTLLLAKFDETDLRTENSHFWGGAFGSSVWDSPKAGNTNDEMILSVPLPALSSEVFAESSLALASRPRALETEPTASKPAEEPIILKRGSKRKSDVISSEDGGEASEEFDISLKDIGFDYDEFKREKSLRKKERKAKIAEIDAPYYAEKAARRAAKKAKKAAAAAAAAEGDDVMDEDEDEEKPFDYSKAEPVLHGKHKEGKRDKKGKETKPFDPYQKSADASHGMRRVQSARAGRSQTFKN